MPWPTSRIRLHWTNQAYVHEHSYLLVHSNGPGRTEDDLMAIGDFSFDDTGVVFLTPREPMGDHLSYFDRSPNLQHRDSADADL